MKTSRGESVFDPHFRTQDPNVYHNVKANDTIGSIAAEHRVSVKPLLEANPNLRELGRVQPGMAVVIPINKFWF